MLFSVYGFAFRGFPKEVSRVSALGLFGLGGRLWSFKVRVSGLSLQTKHQS